MLSIVLSSFIVVFVAPVVIAAIYYAIRGEGREWRSADRSSAGLLPRASLHEGAAVRIFSARTVSWRGVVASHSWVVVKERGTQAPYQRFDYTAWGAPIWIDHFVPDGLWFGSRPEVVFAADDADAEGMIPAIRNVVATYRYPRPGDYRAWPGPNSNTFVAAIINAVPEMQTSLPPTAIGKDFPYDGRSVGITPSGTGVFLNAGGYVGLTIGWVEGLEINLLGAVAGLDFRRPGIKLPALGRIGV